MKTAIAVRGKRPIAKSGHSHLRTLCSARFPPTHNALDDAIAQADVFCEADGVGRDVSSERGGVPEVLLQAAEHTGTVVEVLRETIAQDLDEQFGATFGQHTTFVLKRCV